VGALPECNKVYHPECRDEIKNDCGLTAAMLLKAMNTPGSKETGARLPGGPSMLPPSSAGVAGSASSASLTPSVAGSTSSSRALSITGTLRKAGKFVVGDSTLQSTVRVSNHVFQLYTYRGPAWCKVCSELLWGLAKQGYRCTGACVCAKRVGTRGCGSPGGHDPGCGSDVHADCIHNAIYPCGYHKGTWARAKPRPIPRAPMADERRPVETGGMLRVVDKKEADLSHAVQLRRGPSKGRHARFNRENESQYRLTVCHDTTRQCPFLPCAAQRPDPPRADASTQTSSPALMGAIAASLAILPSSLPARRSSFDGSDAGDSSTTLRAAALTTTTTLHPAVRARPLSWCAR
jgi:hypothetical protein